LRSDNDTVTVTMDSGLDPTAGNVVTRFFRKAKTAVLYGTSVDVHKVRHWCANIKNMVSSLVCKY
jgi:hypothetical protein